MKGHPQMCTSDFPHPASHTPGLQQWWGWGVGEEVLYPLAVELGRDVQDHTMMGFSHLTDTIIMNNLKSIDNSKV